jgi:GDPmannose 4,6-dehydratase
MFNTDRINHLYQDPYIEDRNFILHYGDLTDSMNLTRIIQETQPDEIYNLGAMSHVKVSFDMPEYTANSDGLGALRILEAVRLLDRIDKTRIYQASSAALYGLVQQVPQFEKTPFYPKSPYGVAKLFAYWITVNYREAYGMHASNGILFNHESPIRGETFVTRKITRATAGIAMGIQEKMYIGNLSARRDWGHARDFIKAMHLILQQEEPDDYVIATGITTEVREFIRRAFLEIGLEIAFSGKKEQEAGRLVSMDEKRFSEKIGDVFVEGMRERVKAKAVVLEVDPRYYRPTEVDLLIGNAAKARKKLGWVPEYTLDALIADMMKADVRLMKKEGYLLEVGYRRLNYFE